MSIPFSPGRDTVHAHNGTSYAVAPLSIRITLSLSRLLRKVARVLERVADRLETWARVRSMKSGQRHAFDTITLTPIGSGQPLTATRDARSQVIAITVATASTKGRSVVGGVR